MKKIDIMEAMNDSARNLINAPDGTRITGVFSKRSGMEVIIEKRTGYRTGWDTTGSASRAQFTEWAISGYADPYIKKTLSEVLNGTNKYYRLGSTEEA